MLLYSFSISELYNLPWINQTTFQLCFDEMLEYKKDTKNIPFFGLVGFIWIMHLLPLYFLLVFITCSSALKNGLLKTLPMGWLPGYPVKCVTNCQLAPNIV